MVIYKGFFPYFYPLGGALGWRHLSKPGSQAQAKDFFDIVDLRSVKSGVGVSPRRGVVDVGELKRFFRELGFYVDGSALASKIYEREVCGVIHRLYVEVYNVDGYFTAVFALNTRDVGELKEIAKILNNLLESEVELRGYSRVV